MINSERSFSTAWSAQVRSIGALLLRELHTRYGRENIGYLWFIGEPMMLASVITLVHVSEPSHFGSDILPAPFAIIGYTIFIIFRGIFNRAEGVIEASRSLLYHRQITIVDIIFSRTVLETAGCFSTMVIMLSLAVVFNYAAPPYRPLYLIGAVAFMAWWSFALALIGATLTYGSETLGRQLHVVAYFSIPLSGAFYQLSWIPPSFAQVLRWFPMPLIFEQARYGQFRSASAQYVDPAYVAGWCLILTYVGLLLVRRIRSRLH